MGCRQALLGFPIKEYKLLSPGHSGKALNDKWTSYSYG